MHVVRKNEQKGPQIIKYIFLIINMFQIKETLFALYAEVKGKEFNIFRHFLWKKNPKKCFTLSCFLDSS